MVVLRGMSTMRGNCQFEVVDTGIGMTEEQTHRLDAVYPDRAALSRRHEGTGLGLPLTKALVELHRAGS